MKKIKVNLGRRSYNIIIGCDILKKLDAYLKRLNVGRDAFVITNPKLKRLYGKKLMSVLKKGGFRTKFCCVADTEKSKSLNTAVNVLKNLVLFDKGRRPFIIAFGGGVVGDLASFLASIYKRGIPYVSIPTTLLAQVDSSIGGKTAVDLSFGKNLIGTFHQPRLVFSDVSFLRSLQRTDIISGLSEVIKYGILRDKNFFSYIERNYKLILAKQTGILAYVVFICAKMKAGVIQQDEREEKGLRTLLNLGHTVGHAIEAAGGYSRYNHGQAIALGLLCAGSIAYHMNTLSSKELERIRKLIKRIGLPTKIRKVKLAPIIKAVSFDKKIISGGLRFVLPVRIGRSVVSRDVSFHLIAKVLKEYEAS